MVFFLYCVGIVTTWVLVTAYLASKDSDYHREYSDWIMYTLMGFFAGLAWPLVLAGAAIGLVANHLVLTYSSVRMSKRAEK